MTSMATDQYTGMLSKNIGRGVYEGRDTKTGETVAIRVINFRSMKNYTHGKYKHTEVKAIATCECKNIINYPAYILRPSSSELHIIMEFVACSIADLVRRKPLDEECIAFILSQVVNALVYMHSVHDIHKDLKADKIRLTPDGDVKVAYTLSGLLAKTLGTEPAEQTVVLTCSPFWLPPEAVTATSEDEGFCEKSDVWSLGITAIEMATGDPPHVKRNTLMEVLYAIMKGPPPTLEGEGFSDEFKDFVATCLKKDPATRPTAQELLQHPFIANAAVKPPERLALMVQERTRALEAKR